MRKHYLDNIRWATVLLVVLYHTIFMYNHVVTVGVVGPVTDCRWQDALQYLLYPWFMVVLFLVSGASARYALDSHSGKAFFAERTRKLLVPSALGLLVLGWAQGYFNMAFSHAFENIPSGVPAPVLYLIMTVSGIGVLWTCHVLWVCALVLLAVRRIEGGRLLAKCAALPCWAVVLLGVAAWAAAQVLNTPVIAVYRFGIYLFSYLAGYYVFSQQAVVDALARRAPILCGAAAVLGAAYLCRSWGLNYAEAPNVNNPLAIAYAWAACLAIFGGMKRWGDRTGRFAAFMTQHSFGLYICHYLALSAAAYGLVCCLRWRGVGVYLLSAAGWRCTRCCAASRSCGTVCSASKRRKTMFCDNLISLRKLNGLSQEELAEQLNVSRQTLSKYETGESLPDIERCKQLAEIFGVSLDDLVNYDTAATGLNVPPKGRHVFGLVTVGDKGQIVIPAKARKIFSIQPGDRLIVLGDEAQGLALLSEKDFLSMVRSFRTQGE